MNINYWKEQNKKMTSPTTNVFFLSMLYKSKILYTYIRERFKGDKKYCRTVIYFIQKSIHMYNTHTHTHIICTYTLINIIVCLSYAKYTIFPAANILFLFLLSSIFFFFPFWHFNFNKFFFYLMQSKVIII